MSLSRAFTTRRLWPSHDATDDSKYLSRRRRNISGPVQLIHTTNMLSYNAPDLPPPPCSTVARTEDDSDTLTTESTPPTSPDVALGDVQSPEPNHLTSYFRNAGKPFSYVPTPPPAIPQRSPSHTKKRSFEILHRTASFSRRSRDSDLSAPTFSRSPSLSTRASSISQAQAQPPAALAKKQNAPLPPLPASPSTTSAVARPAAKEKDVHPFGQELAQVSELAEEYGASDRLPAIDEEQQYLETRGLVRLTVADYLGAIQSISASFFPLEPVDAMSPPLWI